MWEITSYGDSPLNGMEAKDIIVAAQDGNLQHSRSTIVFSIKFTMTVIYTAHPDLRIRQTSLYNIMAMVYALHGHFSMAFFTVKVLLNYQIIPWMQSKHETKIAYECSISTHTRPSSSLIDKVRVLGIQQYNI